MSLDPAAIKLLATAFGKKALGNKDVAKEINKGFTALSEVAKNQGISDMADGFEKMGITAPAINLFLAELTSQTTTDSVDLMKSLMTLVQSPASQIGISALAGIINSLTSGADKMVEFQNSVNEILKEDGSIDKFNTEMKDLGDRMDETTTSIIGTNKAIDASGVAAKASSNAMHNLTTYFGLFVTAYENSVDFLKDLPNVVESMLLAFTMNNPIAETISGWLEDFKSGETGQAIGEWFWNAFKDAIADFNQFAEVATIIWEGILKGLGIKGGNTG